MRLWHTLRRPAVLVTVGALLAPLALAASATVAVAADEPTLQVTGFSVTAGAAATTPAPAADPAYASDLAYTATPAGSTTTTQVAYRCASDTEDCVDAAGTVVLDRFRLTAPVSVAGLDPAPTVTYFTDAAATQVTADPAAAIAFRVAFAEELTEGGSGLLAGTTGTFTFAAALVTPSGGGTQQGSAVITPSSEVGAGTPSRVRVTGAFPVNLATTTALAWARTAYLSGVDDGTDSPTNTATVTARLTGDPAETFTVQWGGTDPTQRPAAGTVGMLTDLTDVTVTGWPTDAASVTVTGWRWTGASSAPAQVAIGTVAAGSPQAAADLLAGIDPAVRSALTGLRLAFTAASGSTLPSGATATVVVGVREHASAGSTPVTRAGAAASYVTDAPAATFDPASDLNTLTVTGTATSSAVRGATTSSPVADSRGFRVLDPRPYAGSRTALTGLVAGTVYGGGFVAATAAGTNWSRRAVDQLVLTVPAATADITATNAALDPDLPARDTRVLGSGLAFAGFGAARGGGTSADGSGVVVTGLTGPARLQLTVTSASGTSPVVDLDATAPAVPTDPAAFGLTSWSEVTGFSAVLRGTGAAVPLGATVTLPYLLRAATSAQAQTYAAHTSVRTVLGAETSAITPRAARSGNRPVTAATIPVAVPTVGVAGSKYVVEPYVAVTGGTATVVLEGIARPGASGHLPDTLLVEDSARAATSGGTTGAAWWDVFRPTAVDGEAPAGADVRVEYYTNTTGAPVWQEYAASLTDLQGSATWRGMRVVTTAADGTTFADGTTARARITFATRAPFLNGRTWAVDGQLTNVAQITSSASIEGNVVSSTPTRVSDVVTGVAPGPDGTTALVKVLNSRTGTEGTGTTPTATLTWGTDGQAHTSVVVADANGLAAGDRTPATGGDQSFWDSFDLTRVLPITSGAAPVGGSAYDPYLVFDQITDVRVFDTVDGTWHSLRTEEWSGGAWGAAAGGRNDVTFAAGTFPFVGAFPGMTVGSALQGRVGGIELVVEPRTGPQRDAAVPAGDWRRALLGTLTDGAVASTDGPAREIQLGLRLRDLSRSTGTPVNNAFRYTTASAGHVANSGRVTGWTAVGGAGTATDLGGPINPSGWWTYRIQPGALGVATNKSWLRVENGTPLEPSTDLDQLALPVEGPGAPAEAWPSARMTVTGRSTSTTRVDSLTLTEPAGIDTATDLDADSPFAQFAITDLSVLTDIDGAAAPMVVLYRWDAQDGLTADAPVTRDVALAASETDLADVVGVQARYTGRITTVGTVRLSATTRLLAENRVTGTPTPTGLSVTNEVETRVSDARVCADESGDPTAAAGCTADVLRRTAAATVTVRDPEVVAFPELDVTPVDVQRDATGGAPVTSVLSAQNFGVTEADQLVVTDADPRYFNAVAARTLRVDRLPTGAEAATLEVLVAGDALDIGADGAYDGTQAWATWATGATAGATWDLAALAGANGVTADDVIGVRIRFVDTGGGRLTAPGEGYGQATLAGVLRTELRTGGLPSAVGADGWRHDGAPELTVNPGESVRGEISNRITAQAVRDQLASTEQTTGDVTTAVHAGAATVQVTKAEVDAAARKPGDAVRYRITVANTATGTGAADLTGLVVTDRLPEDGSLVYGTPPDGEQPVVVQAPGGGASPLDAPVVTADEDTIVLTFGADDRLAPGQQVEVLLWVRIADALSTTSVVNTATAGSASRPVVAVSGGTDGGTTCTPGTYDADAQACLATAGALTIGGANVYVSEKWVRDAASTEGAVRTVPAKPGRSAACAPRGTGADAGWYRYPCSVVTTAGSRTDWQIQVASRASVTTDRLEMVDMLPTVGDYPAMDGSASGRRGSQWRPVWDGVVPTLAAVSGLPAGATLQVYTTTADYRAGGSAPSGSFDPVPGTWSATPLTPGSTVPAAQAARVTGFKFVVTFASGDRFSNGERVRVGWSMRTPLTGAPVATDAWNSFAFRVPADAGAGRPADVTSVPLKAGARYAVAPPTGDPLLAVGDRVWLDTDRDGVQGPGESGVEGALVDVFQGSGPSAVWAASATTDAAGDWVVDGLPAGTYQVRVTLRPALAEVYRFTTTDAGADDVDSDVVPDGADPAAGSIADVVLTTAQPTVVAVADMPAAWRDAHPGLTATSVDATRDAGVQWRPVAVGDRVWFDADRDGVQGPGEDAVPGATVRLLDGGADGTGTTVLATTTTGADGGYRFDGLDPGTYRVEVELPDALADRWTFTTPLTGDIATDSDVEAVTARLGRTAAFALAPGAGLVRVSDLAGDPVWSGADADYADPTRDAGLVERPVRVGDRVWADLDGDGVQETGEPGLPGVVLVLTTPSGDPVTDAAGQPVGPVTTAADGAYLFDGLLPGAYVVTVDEVASAPALTGYVTTPAGVGDPATDSSTGTATSATLVGGGADLTLDFGYRPLRALGDRVWLDSDRDGVQDPGEPGFAGATVRLLDAGGAVLGTTTTDADGLWWFDLLEPGDYRVEVELAPADAARYGWTVPRSADAPRADADSDVEDAGTPGLGRTPLITLGPDAPGLRATTPADGVTAPYVDPTWDAGLVERPVSVGDLVWFDRDGDGVQDAGEPGIAGVVLELRTPDGRDVVAADGTPVAPVTTDADGRYVFTGLLPGEYVVRVDRIASRTALAGYAPTVAGAGADRALDSSTWSAGSRVLVGGEDDPTLDFGMVLASDVQLALRKTAVARTATTITWDVTVASTGTQDAYAGFTVIDALPGSLTFRTAQGTGFACAAVDRLVTCDHDGSLAAGESATVRIVTGVAAGAADVTNTASVNVDGRGYRFEVLAAEDDAWSDPVADPSGSGTGAAGSPLAVTGATLAGPLGLAAALLALGAVLLAVGGRTRTVVGTPARVARRRHRA
ncbi:SdrD B-like domain-containing protein [Cellulomonas triticagri]|uniref:DUF11 domain-containing protein n=1 Tax=Cellulomonas triticagri TaxID=2483352 RepID=A0A3M2JTS5_9CELL|nr:SdrD B-like domain-containing protein [Cellulomonas triticagri]RMI14145.1 hypothetical protein EBM89_01390 [Cellulomonas triticagri]